MQYLVAPASLRQQRKHSWLVILSAMSPAVYFGEVNLCPKIESWKGGKGLTCVALPMGQYRRSRDVEKNSLDEPKHREGRWRECLHKLASVRFRSHSVVRISGIRAIGSSLDLGWIPFARAATPRLPLAGLPVQDLGRLSCARRRCRPTPQRSGPAE